MSAQTTDQRSSTESGSVSVPARHVFRGLVRGTVGGLIATVLMTLYRFPVFRALPPTADFWAKHVGGDDTEAYPGTGLFLHFLYGGVAGGLFGAAINAAGLRNEREHGLVVIGLSLAYGLALSLFGTRVVFRYLLKEDLEPSETVMFHIGHVIYGLTLGTWLSVDERFGEVYE